METTIDSRGRFPVGDEISRDYNIVSLLGHGGMGEVYLAEQLRVGRRRVALKVIKPLYSNDPEIVRRFENEAAAAGSLDHQNIVRIYDCRSTSDGRIYVAMEYVEGLTLKRLLSENGPLPLPTIVEIVTQVCAGLEAAHTQGIVHRDVKPDNIMLVEKVDHLTVKILDFGIARLIGADGSLTYSGIIMGSAAYMSPEQADGMTGDRIDYRADVYSFAMVVYEMLAGLAPLKSSSLADAIHKQKYETPPPPSYYRTGLPKEIDEVLLKALAKDRLQRQQSITEFADEFKTACGETDSTKQRPKESHRPLVIPVPRPHSLISTVRRSWAMLPKALKWILVAILIPLVIGLIGNLITLRHGENIIVWIERKLGYADSSSSANTSNQPNATVPAPVIVKFMEYRVMLETPRADLNTLPADNEVRSGEAVHFLIRLAHPGTLYLFHERSDGFLQWVNRKAQNGRSGEWVQIPQNKDQVIAVDSKLGAEKFLLIYVPEGVNWSLSNAISPQRVIETDGLPILPQAAAVRLKDAVRSAGVEMSSTAERFDRTVTHKLVASDVKDKLAFHEFQLSHER